MAAQLQDKPCRVISEAKADTPLDVLPLVGTTEALRKVVQRTNKKTNPLSQEKGPDVAIPEELKMTISGMKFLQVDKTIGKESVIAQQVEQT